MKLNPRASIPAFLQAVQNCVGEVCFVTPEGDNLNLKSALSQFVFAAVIAGNLKELDGTITVEVQEDARLLGEYCS